VGHEPVMQATLYTRSAQNIQRKVLFDTVAPRLHGFSEPSKFAF
jgi:protein-L-isoaspartate(D-aspartate) O-methyltransferase